MKDSRFSGHGHRIGNLLPCCKPCNSKKGNKQWDAFLSALPMSDVERANRKSTISAYIDKHAVIDQTASTSDHVELDEIRKQVLVLLLKGDQIAERIRSMWL